MQVKWVISYFMSIAVVDCRDMQLIDDGTISNVNDKENELPLWISYITLTNLNKQNVLTKNVCYFMTIAVVDCRDECRVKKAY